MQFEALPQVGDSWRLTVEFERVGETKPLIKKLSVEHPPQHVVFTDYPRVSAELGVNFTLLGTDGLYDYDDDEDTDDMIILEGNVLLYVNEMTIEGAGLFVRP